MTLPAALAAFLGAGLVPSPSRVDMARALATARLCVASYLNRQEPLASWLACEIRARGLRENAAVLAVLEIPAERDRAARDYLRRHPTHSAELYELLAAKPLRSTV
ncbi:hypothetical protein Rhe02_95340 [Rhizocola hellebori]|uniref:Uncharacterized protein n=1 Tax=Rhizocola hellebori TaxID=1392758 RepID=A0A8J3QKV0_9ACTN|nr:hypothetical protein [Rhizocola hellebori]GIH11467.1 hypothetical protein Rhe02_95340 [Rhizocola hellebori]